METLFTDIAQTLTHTGEFSLYPPIGKRNAYEDLTPARQREVIQKGEAYLSFSYPFLSPVMFLEFNRTGNRVNYENLYFAKRRALNALVLAECVEDKGRFLDDIINGVFSICEESAWQLPPHNSYIRDTPQLPLPDATRPVLDLFACETGALLATVSYLMGSRLDAVSPFIRTRIQDELSRRIIKPYLYSHYWWMGKEEETMCNWTVWCTQNILLTAFLSTWDEDVRLQIVRKAAQSCDFFLKDYGIDGCCDEGALYYRHAGLCLFNILEILNHVTEHAFAELYQNEKIRNIAAYIYNVHVCGEYYINFADCSPIAGRAGVREFLFGLRTGLKDLAAFAAADYRANSDQLLSEEINLFYRVQSLFTDKEILNFPGEKKLQNLPYRDIFYSSVGLFIARGRQFCLAAKAGDNNDSHNHNDVGSFTIYKNGRPIFIDIGVESYTKKTFSPERYTIWTMQSGYHNLPTVNGLDECAGEEYKAVDVHASLSTTEAKISMDISPAFPKITGLSSYLRTITLQRDCKEQITVKDTIAPDSIPVIINLITYEKPEIRDNCILFPLSQTKAVFLGVSACTQETLPITDARLQTAWKHDLYRIRLTLEKSEFTLVLT